MGGKKAASKISLTEPSPEQVLGEIFQERRLSLGLSQREFATRLSLERSTVAYVERGERQPSLSTILEFALGLNILPSDLFAELEKRLKFSRLMKERNQ